ncbi:hypothetical protein [Kocuria tytonis]|uniref:hypothetical protein n=1 Tax=Kocuria tytonis TaxID=2054280 RepID=UPI0011C36538|nr:hypothetical protein [Kocuria tytonis]
MTVTRRELAKGTMWATPVILATAAAPAMAASPCAAYRPNQPLPPSAFTVTYLNVENETLGGLASKQLKLVFGFKISAEAKACGVTSGNIYSSNPVELSRVSMTNGKSYNLSNGQRIPANGTVGTVDTSCQSGLNGTEACGTSFVSAYNVGGSSGTSGDSVNRVSLFREVDVSGFPPTRIFLNATIDYANGWPHRGGNFSVTSAALM